MGPVRENYQAAPPAAATASINHFSHHHHLQLSHHHNPQTPCSACTHPTSSATTYGCQHCNYYLHASCAKMPQLLQHPFDTNKTHCLTLLPKPAYPEGVFSCDACGHQGSGFSYHCAECRIDLHVLCAALPAAVVVPGHQCELRRMFAAPYPNGKFMCDVCSSAGSKTWMYHCGSCLFDVHLGCSRGGITQQRAVVGRPVNRVPVQYNPPAPYYPQPQVVARPAVGPQIFNKIVEGVVEGVANAVAENAANYVINGLVGGECAGGVGEIDISGITG